MREQFCPGSAAGGTLRCRSYTGGPVPIVAFSTVEFRSLGFDSCVFSTVSTLMLSSSLFTDSFDSPHHAFGSARFPCVEVLRPSLFPSTRGPVLRIVFRLRLRQRLRFFHFPAAALACPSPSPSPLDSPLASPSALLWLLLSLLGSRWDNLVSSFVYGKDWEQVYANISELAVSLARSMVSLSKRMRHNDL